MSFSPPPTGKPNTLDMSGATQDNALDMTRERSRRRYTLLTSRWARFDGYEIREGAIRPQAGANLVSYDPWQGFKQARRGRAEKRAPYESLIALLDELSLVPEALEDPTVPSDFSLKPDATARLLAWCSEHGVLGILPHRARLLSFSAEWQIDQVDVEPDEKERWRTIWGHVPMQRLFVRTASGWQPADRRGDPEAGELPADWPSPHVILDDLGVPTTQQLPLTALERFFPGVSPTSWPLPLSKAFWRAYAEPLGDFLHGARLLAVALGNAKKPALRYEAVESLNALTEPAKEVMTLKGKQFSLQMSSPSLLATFAMMARLDLTKRRNVRQCDACGKLFVASAYQTKYCSDPCRWREQKRTYRAAHPKAGR